MKELGIVDAHAYTLMGCYEITTRDGRRERLMKVRNPWSKFEWNGAWSDNDKSGNWNDFTRKQVNFQPS
jgi:hypothetical protein